MKIKLRFRLVVLLASGLISPFAVDAQIELSNYQNDPDSLRYGTIALGLPKCSYMATFTKGSRPLVEYCLRVAGEESYVMFLTQGTRSEIEAMRAGIDQMADTVRLP